MTATGRSLAVRRWIRRPLWWGAATVALAGSLFAADVGAARRHDRTFDRGHRVTGAIDPGWDGGRDIDVTYRHPDTGDQATAHAYVWDTALLPAAPGPVDLEVSRTDPTDGVVAGDRFPATANLGNYAPWTLLPFVAWGVRLRTVRRTERVMTSSSVAYAMVGSASPPEWWGRRWRLHLSALDAGPAAAPVCTVPLVAPPGRAGPFTVEVKGSPRPYGRVVARDSLDGAILWPSGRALRAHAWPPSTRTGAGVPTAAPKVARWLLWAGAAVLLAGFLGAGAGTFADDVRERSQVVPATATGTTHLREDGRLDVDVVYLFGGRSYTGSVIALEAPGEDRRLSVRIDPESPARVWSTSQDTPPGTTEGALAGLGIVGGFGLLIAGGLLRVRAEGSPRGRAPAQRAGRGLELVDGQLWYRRTSPLTKRPAARFDADALVLVDADGRETAYPWDDHAASATARPETAWHMRAVGPSKYNTAGIWLHSGHDAAGFSSRRLAGGWAGVLWEELPALAAYLGATPSARAGLCEPDRAGALIDELAAGRWRRPRTPGEPLMGDPLDLHVAVTAVVDGHQRRFGGHPVRGEPVPPVDDLVPEVIARLPSWVRQRIDTVSVAERISRHLSTGPWPFDVLVPEPTQG